MNLTRYRGCLDVDCCWLGLSCQYCTFDLGGCDRNAVPFPEHLVTPYRLPVDPDQVVFWSAAGHSFSEELFDGGLVIDLDVVCKAGAVVVDVQNLHVGLLGVNEITNYGLNWPE